MCRRISPSVPRGGTSTSRVVPNVSMVSWHRIYLWHNPFLSTSDPEIITQRSNVPGPGTYEEVIQITKDGRSPVSTVSNSRAAQWSPSKKRFPPGNQAMRDTPGPGQYTPSDCVSGNYVVSTFRNGGSIRMIRDTRPGRTRARVSDTPGPGHYPPHSEFGNYKEYLARSITKKTRNNRGMSETNYSSMSP